MHHQMELLHLIVLRRQGLKDLVFHQWKQLELEIGIRFSQLNYAPSGSRVNRPIEIDKNDYRHLPEPLMRT